MIWNNSLLIRHFLHAQKNDSSFLEIKKNIVPVVIKWNELEEKEWNNLVKLIRYFEVCWDTHSDEIIKILLWLYGTSKTPGLRRLIAISLEKMKSIKGFDNLFKLAQLISKDKDAMIRDFGIRGLKEYAADFSSDQNKQLIQNMFCKEVEDKDVINKSATMSLKFQAKDLKDASFRSSALYLDALLQNPKFTEEFLPTFMAIYDKAISKDLCNAKWDWKIKNHSTWWMKDRDFNRNSREYESDPKKRLSMGLLHDLQKLERTDPVIFKKSCDYIIENATCIWYFEILRRVLKIGEHDDIIKSIVINKETIIALDLHYDRRWEKIFQAYLSKYPESIGDFIAKVKSIDFGNDDTSIEEYTTRWAYFTIPEEQRPVEIQKYINDYETKTTKEENEWRPRKMDFTKWDNFEVKNLYWEEEIKKLELEWFNTERSTEELINKITEYKDTHKMFGYDHKIHKAYTDYFKKYPNQLKDFYDEVKINHLWIITDNRFTGYLSQWQIENYVVQYKENSNKDKFYENLLEFYKIFEDDRQAKLNIAKEFDKNEFIRTEKTWKLYDKNPELFKKIKALFLKFATDPDPETEEENSYLWLNSVRWVAVRLLSVMAHYYPEDKDFYNALDILSDDSLTGIQTEVIENLVYLITKDYDFCKKIIAKFEDNEREEINISMIRYLFRLWNIKLKTKEDLLRKIATRNQEKVQSDLWNIVGQAFAHMVDFEDLINDMISGEIWTADMVESFALDIEREIPKILVAKERKPALERMLSVYKKLLKEYKTEEKDNIKNIKDNLAFLFYDDQLSTDHFDIFDKNNLFETLITYWVVSGQDHLNKYLLRCVQAEDNHLNRVGQLLKKQIENYQWTMLSEDYLCTELVKILKYNLETRWEKWKIADYNYIFDEWLKYWGKGFYEIFDQWYK